MISFFANLFGYVLNFLYEIVGNFGLAIILFSILVKLLMLPISIKQQKTMKKSQKINEEMKQIQFKYKNDQEKLNQEVMSLYKREKMSPFSGCFSAIIQIVLLFSVFYLVRSPLTYMRKIDTGVIEKLETVVQEEGNSSNYKEIAVINYINKLKNKNSIDEENIEKSQEQENEAIQNESDELSENNVDSLGADSENPTETQDESFNANNYIDQVYVNMDFLGIDLSKVPTEDLKDIKVLIIPALYVISSFISIRLSTNTMKKKEENVANVKNENEESTQDSYDAMADANKSMSWIMPIMSISIACIAPLGLALYWLINNILMILERFVLKKFINDNNEEA